MTTQTLLPGLLDIEAVHNVRHMGYCRTGSGGTFCSDVLRAATLGGLTDRGIVALRDVGVTTVVDLRSSRELEMRPTPAMHAHGIHTIHAPVVEYDSSPLSHENFQGYAVRYRELLDLGRGAYGVLFTTIAEVEGAVLFHCSAGKDRTGIAAALLLELAGVSDEEIIEDYARSAPLLDPLFEMWKPRFEEEGVPLETARRLMASDPEDMALTLDYVRERWGSAEGYMLDIGVLPATIARLRERLSPPVD
ncbi:MAG: tyrosine-protein phosphatase [Dehalococcoidia bacterium]